MSKLDNPASYDGHGDGEGSGYGNSNGCGKGQQFFFKGVYKMSEYVVFMNMALFISATVTLVMAALAIYTQDSTKRLVYGILLCIFAAVIATLLVRKSML